MLLRTLTGVMTVLEKLTRTSTGTTAMTVHGAHSAMRQTQGGGGGSLVCPSLVRPTHAVPSAPLLDRSTSARTAHDGDENGKRNRWQGPCHDNGPGAGRSPCPQRTNVAVSAGGRLERAIKIMSSLPIKGLSIHSGNYYLSSLPVSGITLSSITSPRIRL